MPDVRLDGRFDRCLVLRQPAARPIQCIRTDHQHALRARERRSQRSRIVEIRRARRDALGAPLGKRFRLAAGSDNTCRWYLQRIEQVVEYALAEMAACAGDEQIGTGHNEFLGLSI